MMFLFKYRFHCTDTSHTSLQLDESQRDGNPFNNRHIPDGFRMATSIPKVTDKKLFRRVPFFLFYTFLKLYSAKHIEQSETLVSQ